MVRVAANLGTWGGCISGQSSLRAFTDVSTGISMGTVPITISVETSVKAPVILGAVIVRYIQSVSGELDPLQYGILGARARRNLSLLHAMISSQDQCNSLPCTRTVPEY